MHAEQMSSYFYDKINELAAAKLSYWDSEGQCVFANDAYLKWSELRRGSLPVEVVPGQPLANEMLLQALQTGRDSESSHIQYRGRHYRVAYIPDVQGRSTCGCVVQLDDITELKEREQAHHASEIKFRTIVESAPDALIIADDKGRIVLLNSRAEELFGYAAADLVEKPVEVLMPERYRSGHPEKRQGFTQNSHSRAMGNLILEGLRSDGTEFPTDVSLSPMKTGEGLLIAAAFRDITEKVEREKELRRYHEALQVQSSRVESILGSISESFCLIDSDWKIQYWNPAAEKTTEKLRREVLGCVLWDVFPQESTSTLLAECTRAMEIRASSAFEHRSPNGSWYYNSVHPGAEGGLTIYFKDISERKRAELEIISVKNNQNALINATRDLMWSVDRQYRLVSANAGFDDFVQKLYGYRHAAGDCVLEERNTGEHNDEWQGYLDRGLSGESFFVELDSMPHYLTQFNPIADTITGEITGVACHSANTAERNRLEEEKRESAERFQAVVQSGSDLIFILDEQFTVDYASPSSEGLLGPTNGLPGEALLTLVHPESRERVRGALRKALLGRTARLDAVRLRASGGQWLWVEATIDNLLGNASVCGLVVNAKDITEQKVREGERELLIKELTRSNSDLMQFSFITSHNLKAPLSNIRGLLHVLQMDPDSRDATTVLQMIDISTQKLENTITDLAKILFIRNNKEIPTRELDIRTVFDRVNRNFIEAENDIHAIISLDLAEPTVSFNEAYLESIFINLISNSIKYRHDSRPLHIKMSTSRRGAEVRLEFSDNGTGIDTSRHQDRLFGMYQRFHSNSEGHGLGLFIIKAQIQALGGTIEVRSTVGEYTSFIIDFS